MNLLSISLFGLATLAQLWFGPIEPSASFPADSKNQKVLTIDLPNLQCNEGALMVAVFSSAESFPEGKSTYARRMSCAELAGNKVELQLPEGRFAIAVYHDQNGNQKLDRNFFQYPTEPYGFSNNARSMTGPPSFELAAFTLKADMKIEILLR